ncbi:ATP-binding protein [Pseudoalteromonas sp. MMG010]|uniref:sensor histidine kinase n=1 Tax=Pseudoalteromonas sp. MMG010 TaxID=2822685 RepID=UPI001B3A3D55|nr:HAMP domain-containing sensor histidine kinase [Pseudoalteromonas sp. MMG010]MBQ4834682.1 ATP-binding protein [Pseudoalteromonas sp. MMG010]
MMKKSQQCSIKKTLIHTIMLVTASCLSLSIGISTYLSVKEQKKLIINKLTILCEIVAFDAAPSLIDSNRTNEELRLKFFSHIPLIKNIHVYKIDAFSNKPSFFMSYNAKKTPPVPLRIDSIDKLMTPKVTNNIVEIIRPIIYADKTIGHIYMRGSLESLNEYIKKKLILLCILVSIVLTTVYLFTLNIQRRVAEPLTKLSLMLKGVAKSHNYDTQFESCNIKEINQLSQSLNIMLTRINSHMQRHEKDKLEIKTLNLELEGKVNKRTVALREANQELLLTLEKMHQYQNQIVENEKMASLGQMVAGVAHEVNTPIGLGITGSTLLRDNLIEIESHFKNQTLTSGQLKKFITSGSESLDLIYRNLNKAADLINNFKKLAVIEDDNVNTEIKIHTLINDVFLSIKSEIAPFSPVLHILCSTELVIESKVDSLQQILQQLILNSVTHGFENQVNNEITIEVERTHGQITLTYSDNGVGVNKEFKHKLFDPFVTSKRGQGASGLGLHLVYNLVTQSLGGRIHYDTENKIGSRFIITLF